MLSVGRIRASLAAHAPRRVAAAQPRRAAVALVLRERAGRAELLFIERARREGDPWSGHMAFPGGRVEPGDAGARAAAERETREEVGLYLGAADLLAPLGDCLGRPVTQPELLISAYVYHMERPAPLVTNEEVQEAFWFPLAELLDPARHVLYTPRGALVFPGIRVGEPDGQVVWGLTYRFLATFFDALGSPLPQPGAGGVAGAALRRSESGGGSEL